MASILCIETATTNCSIALSVNGSVAVLIEDNSKQFSHAERLHAFIEQVLIKAKISKNNLDAIAISKATLSNIKQNLFGAFIYNAAGIPIAAGVLYPVIGVLLNPIIAGAAMAFSSVTVVTNANRLRLFRFGRTTP